MPGYGVPEDEEGMLPWSHAEERLMFAKNYWVTTASDQMKPHAVPIWGVWLDGMLYFGIGPRSSRNISVNPQVSVHLESGDQVVIVEGHVDQIIGIAPPLSQRLETHSPRNTTGDRATKGSPPAKGRWYYIRQLPSPGHHSQAMPPAGLSNQNNMQSGSASR